MNQRLLLPAGVRDPSAATTAVVYQSPGQAQIPNWDAQNAINFAYYANVFVYRCVQIRATTGSRLAFRVGADPQKPNDYDTKHPLARLLGPPPGGPNPTTSARSLWAWTWAQWLVTGRWAWEIELGARDEPIALWPLASPYLRPVPTEGGNRYFSRFEYGRPGEERTLPAERVFYHWRPKADDWRQPESVLQAARLDVSVAVMQDRYDYAFLRNDARPPPSSSTKASPPPTTKTRSSPRGGPTSGAPTMRARPSLWKPPPGVTASSPNPSS